MKIAKALRISTTLVSQILKSEKSLSPEHTADLSGHMRLNEAETDYLFLLVELDRAGTDRLRARLRKKIADAQAKSRKLIERVKTDKELSSEAKSVYYSSWLYTGVRNLTAIEEFQTAESLSERLQIKIAVVNRIIEFLLKHELCVLDQSKITFGPQWTHIGNESTLVVKHHHNWRLRAMSQMENPSDDQLFFTSPMSLSQEAADKIREMLPTIIEGIQKIVRPSNSEVVRCLNLDWFEY
jgi:uncharacterized protein (TIGR02147 family)